MVFSNINERVDCFIANFLANIYCCEEQSSIKLAPALQSDLLKNTTFCIILKWYSPYSSAN